LSADAQYADVSTTI
jgi:hypothetical protein